MILFSIQFKFCIINVTIHFKRRGSYTDSADSRKKKKATINLQNNDDKCFQYATTVALNYGEIESHPQFNQLNQLLLIFCIFKKKNIPSLYLNN